MVYKTVNGLALQYLHDLFIQNSKNPSCELGNSATDLQILKWSMADGYKGFSFQGTKLWNSLSTEKKS